ncbi:MAG TPA: DNA ligase D, partial [Myxococcota bacterium]|nr:DNA ligase D [Myxococcota bacterium]
AGLPSFQALQGRALLSGAADIFRASVLSPATLYVFDVLVWGEHDLRGLPLVERKAWLARLAPPLGAVRYADHVVGRGVAMFEQVGRMGLEGLMGKRAASPYQHRRSSDWLKIPVHQHDTFAVVGFSAPRGTRRGVGALQLALWDGSAFVYAGAVGTGFDTAALAAAHARLAPRVRAHCPCREAPRLKGIQWTEPGPVVTVRYKQLTGEGLVRQGVFVGWRDDVPAEACRAPRSKEAPPPPAPVAEPKILNITNPDKVFWPATGHTKGDLLAYYEAIAPHLLPYLRDRPLVLTRFPDGIDGKSFFQKDAPEWTPAWVRRTTLWSEQTERDIDYFVCDDVESLLYVINMGTIPLHVWSSRVAALGSPDWCILDLDPKEAPFTAVVQVALTLKALCDDIGLPTCVKTSGSTGLHVLVPLGGALTYDQSRTLAGLLGRAAVRERPDIATLERVIGARGGRVYIDWLQNGHGRLLVAPFSARPVPGALVSTPLAWREVTPKLDFRGFTIDTVPPRLTRQKADPLRPILEPAVPLLPVLEALQARLATEPPATRSGGGQKPARRRRPRA